MIELEFARRIARQKQNPSLPEVIRFVLEHNQRKGVPKLNFTRVNWLLHNVVSLN